MKELTVIKKIEKYLINKGWSKNLQLSELRTHGVDIKVQKIKPNRCGQYWLIEAKGDLGKKVKSPGGSRSSSFNSAIGQIITRMHTRRNPNDKYGGYKYGIAFPMSFKKKVLKNLPYYVCKSLKISVFFINLSGNVEEYNHIKIKEEQNKK